MPFVEEKNREKISKFGPSACENVGDICYIFYSKLIDMWNNEQRWRTAHRAFKDFSEQPEACDYFTWIYDQLQNKFELDDVVCASKLAYKVFFELIVMPYELKKLKENGDIL